ncbi:MAG: hypothetical protein K6L73_14225 [Cellvibrionaceae bacterium]
MNQLTVLWLIALLSPALLHANTNEKPDIAIQEIDFYNDTHQRPVKVRFWYSPANKKCDAQICLPTSHNPEKLAVLSHGAFGSPRSLNWLGSNLAAQGWLVAGVAHYEESWVYGRDSIDYRSVARPWQRAQDIQFLLNNINQEGVFNQQIKTDKVLAAGHSAGGFTALSLAGAKISVKKVRDYCQSSKAEMDLGCNYIKQPLWAKLLTWLGLQSDSSSDLSKALPQELSDFKDNRITAVIALDPALGHGATKESLDNIDIPVAVFGAENNDFLPFSVHAEYFAKNIHDSELHPIGKGAGHFIFIDQCDHNFDIFDIPLCTDREGTNRGELQEEIFRKISEFNKNITSL